MLIEHAYGRRYLLGALEGTPAICERLLAGATNEEIDRRPDPERFTIREIIAHLADWEPVLQERILRTKEENEPTLAVLDPGQLAIDHDYAHSDTKEQIRLFAERRARTVSIASDLSPDQWLRKAVRPNVGSVDMESIVALIPMHDMYHIRQITQWRTL